MRVRARRRNLRAASATAINAFGVERRNCGGVQLDDGRVGSDCSNCSNCADCVNGANCANCSNRLERSLRNMFLVHQRLASTWKLHHGDYALNILESTFGHAGDYTSNTWKRCKGTRLESSAASQGVNSRSQGVDSRSQGWKCAHKGCIHARKGWIHAHKGWNEGGWDSVLPGSTGTPWKPGSQPSGSSG
eukprot:2758550-Pyramimonas_sp.AAC.1